MYSRLLMRIAASRRHTGILKAISRISSILCSLVFLGELAYLTLQGSYITAAGVACAAGVGFVAVTLIRHFIDAPRPYELRPFYKVSPREKKGKSFPSRHAYSAFVIATLAYVWHPLILVGTLVLAVAVALSRVLVGIHFVRDVVCGALLGILAGVLGIIII